MRKVIVPGFESQYPGTKVELAVGLSRDWVAKLRAAGKDNPPYDVVIANTVWVSAARSEGFFETFTAERVPNLRDVWPELRNPQDNGVIFPSTRWGSPTAGTSFGRRPSAGGTCGTQSTGVGSGSTASTTPPGRCSS